MRTARILIAILTIEAVALAFSKSVENAQVDRGKDLFARRCSGCHAADIDMEGPRLHGVYGRKAGGVPGFGYSDSLRSLMIRWDEKSLGQWLTDPSAMAADTDMEFRLGSSEERKAVIAYLKSL